jgi:hypothetical protein
VDCDRTLFPNLICPWNPLSLKIVMEILRRFLYIKVKTGPQISKDNKWMLNKGVRSAYYLTAHIYKKNHFSSIWKLKLEKLTCHIFAVFNVKSSFSLYLHKFLLCLAWYWKVEFSNLTPHLFCFCVLFLLLHNSGIKFHTIICLWRVSADKLHILTKLFSVGQKHP